MKFNDGNRSQILSVGEHTSRGYPEYRLKDYPDWWAESMLASADKEKKVIKFFNMRDRL